MRAIRSQFRHIVTPSVVFCDDEKSTPSLIEEVGRLLIYCFSHLNHVGRC